MERHGSSETLIVQTEQGTVRGARRGRVHYFGGIPYAAPPVGPLRWRPPQPALPWSGIRDTEWMPNRCLQPAPPMLEDPQSEDCLTLNVTVPLEFAAPLPVMIWLHGGAFATGAGADYDCSRLAAQGNVIMVTINYRLGALGFLALAGLEGGGQFGFLDQQAALAWVRRNVSAFGGDASNITLFGESAGATSTALHLTAETSRGLFDRVILQSGSPLQRWPRNMHMPGSPPVRPCWPIEEAEQRGAAMAKALGASTIDHLRQLAPGSMLPHFPQAAPAFGAGVLPEDPSTALRKGRFSAVPILWGGTRAEARTFIALAAPNAVASSGAMKRQLQEAFGERADDILARYPTGPDGVRGTWAEISSDVAYARPLFDSLCAVSRYAPTYGFEFADEDAPDIMPMPAGFAMKSGHCAELAYLFDLRGRHAPFTPMQEHLAGQMISYWTNFAATGDPNGDNLPRWQRFDPADSCPFVLGLDTGQRGGPAPFDFAERHQTAFWSTFP